MRRVHLMIRGDVQGVGYRYTFRLIASRLGVTGWVRNRSDGSVEAEIEGEPHSVEDALQWVGQGPPGARVDDVELTDIEAGGGSGFDVRETA